MDAVGNGWKISITSATESRSETFISGGEDQQS